MPNTQSRWFEITRLSSQAEPRGTGRTRLGWRLPWQSNRGRFTPFQAKRCGFLGEVKCVNIAGAFEKKTETHCWSPQGFLLIELSNLLSLLSAGEQERGAAAKNSPCVLGQTGWDLLFLAGGVWGLQDPQGITHLWRHHQAGHWSPRAVGHKHFCTAMFIVQGWCEAFYAREGL